MPIEFYGPDAYAYARKLTIAIGGPSYINTFSALDIALQITGDITDEPVLRSATREPGASMMISVEWTDSDTGAVGTAATVETKTEALEVTP